MTSIDHIKPSEKQADKAQQTDVTAALVEMYNRKAIELPHDPWVETTDRNEPVTEAIDELYN
jgi:hypothetical protein